jgi:DNA uptake protein ComE-like DNA-binding protein
MNESWWKSYLKFSSIERRGITALLVIILILLITRFTMPMWVRSPQNIENKELLAAWSKYKAEHTASRNNSYAGDDVAPKGNLFPFDPNTLDSIGFVSLGLRPNTVHLLLNWRRKGKTFYKKEDLKPLYTLKEEDYQRLEPFITISSSFSSQSHNREYENSYEPLPATIDLNTTDSSMLVRLEGIGPVLAHKIVEKRKALGGFLKHEQLTEVYPFPDSTFKMLREKMAINPQAVHKLRLNTATEQELRTHPYIGEKIAKNIILLRDGLKGFSNLEQLRQVPLMNEENYRKIAPYCTLE